MDLRSLTRGLRKALVFPLLLGGAISVALVAKGAADEPGLIPSTMTAPITVPFFTQSTSTGSVSYLRIINHSDESGMVSIVAYDDAGSSYGPATLELDVGEAVHFNAADLEAGNEEKDLGDKDKGFGEGIGTGTGAWRLELTSALNIEVFSYSRTEGGVVSGMQEVVPRTGSGYRITLFNPASTVGQESRLRLVNRGAEAVAVTIEGKDDRGESPGGAVRLTLPARGARMVTAEELESGDAEGLTGALGDGTGRWRLLVTAGGVIEVMHLLASTASGEMTNLSAGPVAPVDGDNGATTIHEVGLFPAASEEGLEGVVRIVNRTRQFERVNIEAIDDTGTVFGPVALWISGLEGLVVTSADLEEGNTSKGLPSGTGAGTGDWRLRLSTSLEIEVQSYVHPLGVQDGLLSAMHAMVPRGAKGHRVTLFDPDEVTGSSGSLRLINPSATEAAVTIRGVDGTGGTPGGEVRLKLGAGESREVTVAELEEGTGTGLMGALGDGTGRWHLSIESNRRIGVMSLLSGPGGRLTNLSARSAGTVGEFQDAPPGSGDTATAAEVFSAHISSSVVQSRCINCHVQGGVSGHTRLVFQRATDPDHEALNLKTFADFLSTAEGGASLILNKIQGVSHGGGEQVPADSDDFAQMERFLERLEGPGELFGRHISERVVQSRCIYCHVQGGRSGHTRLVFEPETNPDHAALNLQTFENFLAEVEGGASLILNKIQGVSHGGGEQVPANSDDFAQMERFLSSLDADVVPATITVDTLFDPVRMASVRKTLRRAALIFAGRVPTEEEYAAAQRGPTDLRATIRELMTGPEFHEFLIRGANDRLLTERDWAPFLNEESDVQFVEFINESYRRKKPAFTSGNQRQIIDYHEWAGYVQFGVRRAPLELVAHVVENDLPYTEILTADYVMANPMAATAYGAGTRFDDSEDPHEFRPSRIESYYRTGAGFEYKHHPDVQVSRILNRGSLSTHFPHAGILNTKVFLERYPTTATNRNRARARWTYYHFLGLDVEKSASRTTDPVALADTNNPTMHNPACTVCHSVLDPVAGAFQNYGDEGLYKNQWGGVDSLDRFYKETGGEEKAIQAESWEDRETLSWLVSLAVGTQTVRVLYTNDYYDPETGADGRVYLDRLQVTDSQGGVLYSVEFEDLGAPDPGPGIQYTCGGMGYSPAGNVDHLDMWNGGLECAFYVDVPVPGDGLYNVELVTWMNGRHALYGGEGLAKLAVAVNPYQPGDIWYRDMRVPGFAGELAPNSDNSVQWLAKQIVADPRFAEATVKFWWPAIMGSEVAEPPAEQGDADFDGQLLAANAQSAEVRRLATGFRQGFNGRSRYNLKDLLVEIVLSDWFRADTTFIVDPVRRVALRDAGAKRLLTPEELARKTAAITGVQWKRQTPVRLESRVNALTDEYRLVYGGIDSDGITDRAREITSVMAGVARRHAARVSCAVVMREFFLVPEPERNLFSGIELNVTPGLEFNDSFEIEAGSGEDRETLSLEGWLPQGSRTVKLSFTNDYWGGSPDADRNVHLDRLDVRDATGLVVASYELETVEPGSDCKSENGDNFALWCNASLDVPIQVPESGQFTIEVVAWADQAGDELARLDIVVLDPMHSGAGASAIRNELVELHEKLLGVEVTPHSPDVEAAYQLFLEEIARSSEAQDNQFNPWECKWAEDQFFFEGVLDGAVVEYEDENGWRRYGYDWNRLNEFMQSKEWSDHYYTAKAWNVVLAYLLMDYRYLYF